MSKHEEQEAAVQEEEILLEEQPAQEPDAPDPLQEELEQLKKENQELNDRLLRSAAEFDNYRKRTQKEKTEMSAYGKSLCITEILGVVDNFERGLAAECQDPDFKKGMELIFQQLSSSLQKLGVEEIPALNEPFDPELHNAIKQMEDDSFGENTVCQVLQKGYRLEGKVIRHAMVVVANP